MRSSFVALSIRSGPGKWLWANRIHWKDRMDYYWMPESLTLSSPFLVTLCRNIWSTQVRRAGPLDPLFKSAVGCSVGRARSHSAFAASSTIRSWISRAHRGVTFINSSPTPCDGWFDRTPAATRKWDPLTAIVTSTRVPRSKVNITLVAMQHPSRSDRAPLR